MTRTGIWWSVLILSLGMCSMAYAGSKRAAKRHYDAGVKQGRSGELAGAIDSFRQALKEDPKMFKAALDLGLACSMTKRWPEAIAAYQLAVKAEPKSAKARKGLGADPAAAASQSRGFALSGFSKDVSANTPCTSSL